MPLRILWLMRLETSLDEELSQLRPRSFSSVSGAANEFPALFIT
jgi:hypothetical protein